MTNAASEMCRLVVHGPQRQLEVAVPADVPVADLLPVLLSHLGGGLADAGLAHGGWVLQRLGEPPLNEDSSVATLGLHDGDLVYLRPRSDQIPPVHFDDLADGLATGVRGRSGLWRPEMIRWSALGVLVLLLLLGLAVVALPGPPIARAFAAALIALICLGGAFSCTRAAGDRGFGLVAALGGIAYAFLAGLIAPDAVQDDAALGLGSVHLFTGAVAGGVVALLAGLLLGWAGPLVVGVFSAALYGTVGAGMSAFLNLPTGSAAAVVVVLATVLTVPVPLVAFRLAKIRLAPLPTEPEHLQEEIDPEPSDVLLVQTARADRFMTGLYLGNGFATTIAMLLLVGAGGWAAWTLAGLVALVRLLSLRPMTSAWHRLGSAVPAVLGLALLALLTLADAGPLSRLAVVAGFLPVAGLALFALGSKLPNRRIMPYWGRVGDVAQLLSTVAMLPILLALLGAYGAARALAG
ncbi:type VII secretion integral membrane protein EccD [Micromonospora chokoriensis]|uniref:type VII secretion integral membrane protein EccD n=1 Tax=Micromonospora chokoriensis TaxID=356851 RepID=UPI000568D720|nr:type VII secretion integral membrane protein EccD [Micromonospora chokoriensis]